MPSASSRTVSICAGETFSALGASLFSRTRYAAAEISLPASVSSRKLSIGRLLPPSFSREGCLTLSHTQATASRISAERMRPSLSGSSRARVLALNSRPWVGQLMAIQSFWSSLPRFCHSQSVCKIAWSRPLIRRNVKAFGDFFIFSAGAAAFSAGGLLSST